MKSKFKSLLCAVLIAGSAVSSASALEYSYGADMYDNYFYTPTSSNHALDIDSASDSGGSAVVVQSASMGGDASQNGTLNNSPRIPVGSYIDPWGQNVDTQIETGETLNGLSGQAFNSLVGDYGKETHIPSSAPGASGVCGVPASSTVICSEYSNNIQYTSSTTSCAAGIPVLVTPTILPTWTATVTPAVVTTPVVQVPSNAYSNGLFTERCKVASTCGHFGAVSIGNRRLFSYVYPSASSASMQKGAGHVDGTSVWDGNVVLCGHNRGSWPYFSTLKNVRLGDVITYKTSLGTRIYRVTYSGRIYANDTSVLKPSFNNQITMLTCVANEPSYRYCVIGQMIGSSKC